MSMQCAGFINAQYVQHQMQQWGLVEGKLSRHHLLTSWPELSEQTGTELEAVSGLKRTTVHQS